MAYNKSDILFIYSVSRLIKNIPGTERYIEIIRFFSFWGEYSTYMWLTHIFFNRCWKRVSNHVLLLVLVSLSLAYFYNLLKRNYMFE